jgi:hypothetical protein
LFENDFVHRRSPHRSAMTRRRTPPPEAAAATTPEATRRHARSASARKTASASVGARASHAAIR